jgi:hypothetical protein
MFMKLLLDDFSMNMLLDDLDTHLPKLRLCFDKCKKFGISLNPKKCMLFCIQALSWDTWYPRKVNYQI